MRAKREKGRWRERKKEQEMSLSPMVEVDVTLEAAAYQPEDGSEAEVHRAEKCRNESVRLTTCSLCFVK